MSTLYIANGDKAGRTTRNLLKAIQPEKGLDKNARIGLKPNLVVAKNHKSGATTNPDICEQIIRYFHKRGYKNICIIESSWLGEDTKKAFRACGYTALAKKYGVALVDVKKDAYVSCEYGGMKIDVSKHALALDFLINLPLIKGHCQTGMTCALKNLKGLISDHEKRRFHAMGLHKPIAYLNKMIAPALTIADGICADPGFEEGGNPVRKDIMIAGTDSVLVDAYAAELLGHRANAIEYINIAQEIGIGSNDLESTDFVYIGGRRQTPVHTRPQEIEEAKKHIVAREACSACYGSLVGALIQMGAECGDMEVCVGQGYKGKSGRIGSGNCTSRFDFCIKGCPPNTETIIKELQNLRRDT